MVKQIRKINIPRTPTQTARDMLLILVTYLFSWVVSVMITEEWLTTVISIAYFLVAFAILWRLDNKNAKEQQQLIKELEENIINGIVEQFPNKESINKLTTAVDKLTTKLYKIKSK
jgi:hypothetical protein